MKRNVRTATLVAAAVVSWISMATMEGAVVVSLQEVGNDVVATVGGTANLGGASPDSSGVGLPLNLAPATPHISVGDSLADSYSLLLTGPTEFGSGIGPFQPTSSTGDFVLMDQLVGLLMLPEGYVSGNPLSSTATWENTTLSALTVTPGTYVWSWQVGDGTDTFTLYAGVTPPPTGTVPTLSEWGMIALVLLLGAAAVTAQSKRRKILAGA